MTRPTDQDLIDRWLDEPAPLLPILHAFHDRDGFLSEESLRSIAKALKQPLADLFGTVTFYHHFAREPEGHAAPRVCTGPVCKMRGADEVLEALRADGATEMPCSGRCDAPVPVLKGNGTYAACAGQPLQAAPDSPVPPANPGLQAGADLGGFEECAFADLRHPDQKTLEGYLSRGGFEGLRKAASMPADELLQLVTDSGLAGRGGAGFPTGRKWQAVADAPGEPKSIVCNADEGEPGCFKDRALMDHDPFALLEGMAIAALATGSHRGFIYLRYEYPETMLLLERCIEQATAHGALGDSVFGSSFSFHIHLRRGAGAYVCGEEGSLLNSLEGKHPFPRNRPPFPVTHGFE